MNTFNQLSGPRLGLIIVTAVFCMLCLSAVAGDCASGQPLEVTTSNELTLVPSDQLSVPSFDSELTVAYETQLFYFEADTAFDLEGYDEADLNLEFSFTKFEWVIDLEFDSEYMIDSWGSSLALDLSSEVELEAEYETDPVYGSTDERPDRELELTLDQEFGDNVSMELSSEFTNEGGSFSFPPDESEIELDNLPSGDFLLDSSLELTEMKPIEVEFDLSRTRPLSSEPHFDFQVDLSWGIAEDFLEFDPEFEAEFGTVSFETELNLTNGSIFGGLLVKEVKLSELILGLWDIDITRDFETGETEIDLQTGEGPTELDLGCDYNPGKSSSLFGLDRLTGEFTWEPSENSEISIEMESDTDTFPSEITLSSEHTF